MPLDKLFVTFLPLLLPGCLTAALWDLDDDEADFAQVLCSDAVHHESGSIEVAGRDLLFRATNGDPRWLLRPLPGDELLHTILVDEALTDVLDVTVHATETFLDERLDDAYAIIEVLARLRPEAIAQRLPAAECSTAPRAAISPTGAAREGALHRRCASLLTPGQLQWLLPDAASPRRVGYVYTNGHDQPVAFPANLSQPNATMDSGLRDQLCHLQQHELLVCVSTDDGELLVRVFPERLWLATRMRTVAGRTSIASKATFFAAMRAHPRDGLYPPTQHAARLAHQVTRLANRRVGDDGPDIWTKLALTPITLLVDIPLLWLQSCLDDGDE